MADIKKKCTRCGELKPRAEYPGRHGRCVSCRNAEKREYRSGARTGRKPKQLLPAIDEPDVDIEADAMPQSVISFENRLDLERDLKAEMSNTLVEYNTIIASAKRMLARAEAAGEIGEVVKQQSTIRSAIKDKQAMLRDLTKQFELLANLDKPMSEDPKYTPVTLVLQLEPPADALVDKVHYLQPDDIQEGQDIE